MEKKTTERKFAVTLKLKNLQLAGAVTSEKSKEELIKRKAHSKDLEAKGRGDKALSDNAAPKKAGHMSATAAEVSGTSSLSREGKRIRAKSKSAFAGDRETKETSSHEHVHEGSASAHGLTEAFETITEAASVESTFSNSVQEAIQEVILEENREETKETIKASYVHTSEKRRTESDEEPPTIANEAPPVQKEEKISESKINAPALYNPIRFAPRKAHAHPRDPLQLPPVKLGITGKHIRDLAPPPVPAPKLEPTPAAKVAPKEEKIAPKKPETTTTTTTAADKEVRYGKKGVKDFSDNAASKGRDGSKTKQFHDLKPLGRSAIIRTGDDEGEEGGSRRRKRRPLNRPKEIQKETPRPTFLSIRLPIVLKDLAAALTIKASEIIAYLFKEKKEMVINSVIDDPLLAELIGEEFGCKIEINTAEERHMRVTENTIKEEITATTKNLLQPRAPVITFMGHVDHGKTSLIDYIRKTKVAAGEAGAITQHIGAFRCKTAGGEITILDTPGHEAFNSMRSRGAEVTDIVVLVIAGDDGIMPQTIESIAQAKAAKVTIVVALNKCDKPGFDEQKVKRQLGDNDLLSEDWGGTTLTVNCSATTGQGVDQLLELLALQAEVLELKANPDSRARGSVLESEKHTGVGCVATVLVQNGTLRLGDALIFGTLSGRVKTMFNDDGEKLTEAGPSTPVKVTGLTGLPQAGDEFIVVKNEREARDIAAKRAEAQRKGQPLIRKPPSLESLMQNTSGPKIFNLILRTDMQGSLEALKTSLMKIKSDKVLLNITDSKVGEITTSDIELAKASKAAILGFHTVVEARAKGLLEEAGIITTLHNIIYDAIEEVKGLMKGTLDKLPQEDEMGVAEVRQIFTSSHAGTLAGCMITKGIVGRNHQLRLKRDGALIWVGKIASLKRVKDDVKEVTKGLECGIRLNNCNHDILTGDIIETFDISWITQEL